MSQSLRTRLCAVRSHAHAHMRAAVRRCAWARVGMRNGVRARAQLALVICHRRWELADVIVLLAYEHSVVIGTDQQHHGDNIIIWQSATKGSRLIEAGKVNWPNIFNQPFFTKTNYATTLVTFLLSPRRIQSHLIRIPAGYFKKHSIIISITHTDWYRPLHLNGPFRQPHPLLPGHLDLGRQNIYHKSLLPIPS